MESVVVQRVVHTTSTAIRQGNRDFLQSDDFVGRDRIDSPVPIRLTKVRGSLYPVLSIDLIGCRNLGSLRLQNLLEKKLEHRRLNQILALTS